jgi:ADP-ribosylglycohydrolase
MRLTWVQPEDLLPHELVASAAEGKPVADVRDRWVAAGGGLAPARSGASDRPAPEPLRRLAAELLDELDALPVPPPEPGAGLPASDALADIEATWPAPPALPGRADRSVLFDRIHGGWLGRAAGCLLGKPVEKIPREGIEAILRSTGRWPLDGYFTAAGLDPAVAARWPWNRRSAPNSLAENIDGMPEDDDLNYAILALRLLERRGGEFDTGDVAQAWLDELPAGRVFTAERAVYRNLLEGVAPERAAVRRNPFRAWIGALIRTDVYGWARPGDPRAAARLAWRDGRLSHTGDGLYGAMFVAAMTAAACVADDVETVLAAGLAVVPAGSGLAEAVRYGASLGAGDLPVAGALDALHDRYGHLHWVHVLNNAATIGFALARGRGAFESVCPAVLAGWDTDSVGATVGSVCGTLSGAGRLPSRWVAPLHDRIATSLPGEHHASLRTLSRRTCEVTR